MTQQTASRVQNDVLTTKRKSSRKRNWRASFAAYVFLAPYLVLMIMFAFFPVLYALGLSFYDSIEGVFWGLTNYRAALDDYRMLPAVKNVLSFVSLWVLMMVIGVTFLALSLDAIKPKLAVVYRTIYYVPGAIASSAVVVLWLFLLEPQVSPFHFIYNWIGWENRQQTMEGMGEVWIFSLMGFLSHSGGWIVVVGGALASVPTDVLESARIDGANRWQLATQIKIPLISRTIILMAIVSVSAGIQIFIEPHLLGLAGGIFERPDWSVTQLGFFYAFTFGDFGVAAAISVLSLILPLVFAFVLIFATKFYKID